MQEKIEDLLMKCCYLATIGKELLEIGRVDLKE